MDKATYNLAQELKYYAELLEKAIVDNNKEDQHNLSLKIKELSNQLN